jgi:hypothetical protein
MVRNRTGQSDFGYGVRVPLQQRPWDPKATDGRASPLARAGHSGRTGRRPGLSARPAWSSPYRLRWPSVDERQRVRDSSDCEDVLDGPCAATDSHLESVGALFGVELEQDLEPR